MNTGFLKLEDEPPSPFGPPPTSAYSKYENDLKFGMYAPIEHTFNWRHRGDF